MKGFLFKGFDCIKSEVRLLVKRLRRRGEVVDWRVGRGIW